MVNIQATMTMSEQVVGWYASTYARHFVVSVALFFFSHFYLNFPSIVTSNQWLLSKHNNNNTIMTDKPEPPANPWKSERLTNT